MKTLYDENGDPQEVETPEEIKAKLDAEYQVKLKEAEDRAKQLEDEPVAQNFKMLREKAKKSEQEANEYKKKLSELGQNPDANKAFTREEAEVLIKQRTHEAVIEREKSRAFAQFDAETKPVVESYFNKITAGETLDPDSISEYVEKAAMLARPMDQSNPIKRVISAGSGKPPRTERTSFTETSRGQELASRLNLNLK